MREILFKIKRKDTGEWIGCMIDSTNELIHIAYVFEFDDKLAISAKIPDADFGTICQYTGLTDKNDQKIWEGDILKIVDGDIDEEDGFFVVRWSTDGARFILEGNLLVTDFDHTYSTNCEVVGNIFDNPELIEGEDDDRE